MLKIFNILNVDLFYEIINQIDDLFPLRSTCKNLKLILDDYGYLRKINYNTHTNFMEFIEIYDKFSNSIRTLNVDSIIEPFILIPEWPKIVNFTNCVMGPSYIDPPTTSTEILSIAEHTRNSLLHINWKKFPKLRAIYIRTWDIVLDNLDKCQDLEIICIDLQNTKTYLPPWVGKFPNLKIIIVNMKTQYTYHFISPYLELCLIPKQTPFTSNSKLVPRKQLETNMYITLGGWEDRDNFVLGSSS